MKKVIATNDAPAAVGPYSQAIAVGNMPFANVVKTTVFLTDLANFAAMNAVYSKYFVEPFPARSTIQVAGLPRGAQVEIEVTAVSNGTKPSEGGANEEKLNAA